MRVYALVVAVLGVALAALSVSVSVSSQQDGVFRPLVSSQQPQCSNVSSIRFTLDMLLGTWYVVEVLPGPPQGCDGFQLVSLNASSRRLKSEAFIISRFQRSDDGFTVYDNRTLLIDSDERDTLASHLAMTDYAPDGKFLCLTVCRGGENWTYVYSRDSHVSASDLDTIHERLSRARVINGTAHISNSSLCVW